MDYWEPKIVKMYRIVFLLLSSILFFSCKEKKMDAIDLPYYNDPDFNPIFIKNKSAVSEKINHNIDSFSFLNQDRLFLFCTNLKKSQTSKFFNTSVPLNSISEVFSAANWLERENSELHGINFSGKKDLRNLLLQYGDNSFPFQKSFPSIGLKEMFFNPIKDTLIQSNVSLQI